MTIITTNQSGRSVGTRPRRIETKNLRTVLVGIPPRCRHLPPVPIIRRQCDENLAFGVGGNIGEEQQALALGGAALAKRDEAAQTAVGSAITRKAQQTWRVLKIEPCADDEAEPRVLRRHVGADHTGERIAIGNRNRGEAQRLGFRHQFIGVRGAAQEREVTRHLQFGVANSRARRAHG